MTKIKNCTQTKTHIPDKQTDILLKADKQTRVYIMFETGIEFICRIIFRFQIPECQLKDYPYIEMRRLIHKLASNSRLLEHTLYTIQNHINLGT